MPSRIERRDLSNERNTFKSKTIFYHKKTRLKPERATRPLPKRRRPLYATATLKADPEKKKASVRDSYKADSEKKASVRDSYTTQILNLSNLLKGSDIKRTSENRAATQQKQIDACH